MKITRRHFMQMTAGAIALSCAAGQNSFAAAGKKDNRPNILLILADDMGYSDAACYGGEIHTPNLSALAEKGLRFTQHYSTGRCWPSRACLMAGYYAQHIQRDVVGKIKKKDRPSWAPLLPELIKPSGYRSYHSGKWHIDGTPLGGGFDRSYGDCDASRFFGSKPWQEDNLKAPVQKGQEYYSTIAIADHAIACLQLHEKQHPDKPFFQYVAFYSPHFPLQAMQEDIDTYRGTYAEGWDVIRQRRWERMTKMGLINCALSARQPDVFPRWNLTPKELKEKVGPGEEPQAVAWDTLTEEQKKFQAAKMEIHAAMITRMDNEIGRIVEQLKKMNAYENTLILFASDNGASAEQIIRGGGHDPSAAMGSAKSFVCLGPGWSTAANTPFKLHKSWNHEGGISSPLIAHWPKGIEYHGQLRHDPSHFIDIVPTIMELAEAPFPTLSKDGKKAPARSAKSLIPAFQKDGSVVHEYLWWAHDNNRAIRQGNWKLSARNKDGGATGPWELYDLSVDRCEMNDLASKYPDRVDQMAKLWQKTVDDFQKDLSSK